MITKSLTSQISSSIVASGSTQNIQVVEVRNPEFILPPIISWYFKQLDLANLHPNFPTVRVGNTHPFAMLLYQEVQGQDLDLSVFPSITVIDSSSSQIAMELGNGQTNGTLYNSGGASVLYPVFRQGIVNGQFKTSMANVALLDAAMNSIGYVNYTSTRYVSQHNIDINIWAENKDFVSELFDLVSHFFIDNKIALHESQGLQLIEAFNGRRSGDINLDFGKLLYGAVLTVPMMIEHHSYNFTINNPTIITSVDDTTVYPGFTHV
jgi:hypothetical protein